MDYPSDKHLGVIKVLSKGNEDGTLVDLDQLLERLPYKVTKESFHFTLRTMAKHGWANKCGRESRRGRNRVTIELTPLGRHLCEGNRLAPTAITDSFYSTEMDIDLDIV